LLLPLAFWHNIYIDVILIIGKGFLLNKSSSRLFFSVSGRKEQDLSFLD
jgi:hypothetical protein